MPVAKLADFKMPNEKGSQHATKVENGERIVRLNLNLPYARLEEAKLLARKRGSTVTELVKAALRVLQGIEGEMSEGHRIVTVNQQGEIVGRIVIP